MIWKTIIGMLAGGGLGFASYWFIGCSTGACALTSNPYLSTGWGAALGALFVGSIKSTNKTNP